MDRILTTQQLFEEIRKFKWTRTITRIHPHATWRPRKVDYNGSNGLQLNQNMRNYHMNTNKWGDIGQHLSLLPDGKWVTGRNWNSIPCSISGRNTGSFMVEMIGDFDKGAEKLEGAQLKAIAEWCSFCLDFFKLPESAIEFHREHAAKTCPGSGIEKPWFLGEVRKVKAPQPTPAPAPQPTPQPTPQPAVQPLPNYPTLLDWQVKMGLDAIDDLVAMGMINSPERWRQELDKPVDYWMFFSMLARSIKEGGKK